MGQDYLVGFSLHFILIKENESELLGKVSRLNTCIFFYSLLKSHKMTLTESFLEFMCPQDGRERGEETIATKFGSVENKWMYGK